MAGESTTLYDRGEVYGDVSYRKTLVISVVLHALVLVVLPIMMKVMSKPKKFDRPQTFQLVTMPLPPTPPAPPVTVPEVAPTPPPTPPEPTPAPRPEPTPTPTPTPPKPEPTPRPEVREPPTPAPTPPKEEVVRKPVEENIDDLAALLTAQPAVQVSVQGDFKYNHYIAGVINKIQRFWNPGTEDTRISVVVSFTINKDGTATNISVSNSSGNPTIDRLARDAVERASPFGALPLGFSGDRIEINSTLRPTRRRG